MARREAWQLLPKDVLDEERRQDEAGTWAENQRAQLAAAWAENQRAQTRALLQRYAPPEPTAPPEPAGPPEPVQPADDLKGIGQPKPPLVPDYRPERATGFQAEDVPFARAQQGQIDWPLPSWVPHPPSSLDEAIANAGAWTQGVPRPDLKPVKDAEDARQRLDRIREDAMNQPRPLIGPGGLHLFDPRLNPPELGGKPMAIGPAGEEILATGKALTPAEAIARGTEAAARFAGTVSEQGGRASRLGAAATKAAEEATPTRRFYRGTVPGETRSIDESFEEAKGLLFVARSPESARNYGPEIEEIVARPGARILDQDSPEFWKLIGRKVPPNASIMSLPGGPIPNVNRAIKLAREAGYDAVSFLPDSDIGTVILNEQNFVRTGKTAEAAVTKAPEEATRRFYHGTGSAFDAPDAARFDPNGRYGPGYYLTSDPRVASGYARGRQVQPARAGASLDELKAELVGARNALARTPNDPYLTDDVVALERQIASGNAGPNVRAIDVPEGLNLLDVFGDRIDPKALDNVERVTGPMPNVSPMSTGETLYQALVTRAGGDKNLVNQTLATAGYDGIRYPGGQMMPIRDAAGNPVEHEVLVIFPEALPKLRNALSGTPMGAATGGLAGNETDEQGNITYNPEKGALGLAAGLAAGRLKSPRVPPRVGKLGPELQSDVTAFLTKFPDHLRPLLEANFARYPERFEEARRGVISDVELRNWAQRMGVDAEKFVARWKPGKSATGEMAIALRQTLANKTQDVLEIKQQIADGDNSSATLLSFQQAIREHKEIQDAVMGVRAEAGRTVRSFRQDITDSIESGDVQRMNRLLEKLGGREWTEEMAKRLALLDENDPYAVFRFLRDATKPELKDYLLEIWYNSILSNPATHVRNLIGNTISTVLLPLEQATAAAVGVPLSALSGRPRQRFFGEVPSTVIGLVRGVPDGLREAMIVLREGLTPSQAAKLELQRAEAFRGPLGAGVNQPSRWLTAGDVLFSGMHQRAGMYALAYRQATAEKRTVPGIAARMSEILAEPTAELIEQAGTMAAYRLFRQAPKPWVRSLLRLREQKVFGLPLLQFVLPFVQTPANLIKFGLERSPLGWLNPDLWKNVVKGSPEASDNIARAFIGSMAAGAIYLAFKDGRITAGQPRTEAERDEWARQGKQAYSVRVGDQWVSWQSFEPLTETLTLIAGVVDAQESRQRGADLDQAVAKAAFTATKGITDRSYFSGLGNLIEALEDPDRSASSFLAQTGAAFVPPASLSRAVAQTLDPTIRRPRGVVEAVKNQTPGLTRQVPPRVTGLGDIRKREMSPLLPVQVTTARNDALTTELARQGIRFGAGARELGGIDLTPDERVDYQILSGRLIRDAVLSTINDPNYKGSPSAEQHHRLESAIDAARQEARQRFLSRITPPERERRHRESERRRAAGVGR